MINSFEEVERKTLADMIEWRDLLNRGIAELQYSLDHPLPPIQVDFKAIKEQARKHLAFFEECTKKREKREREEEDVKSKSQRPK